MLQKPCAMLAWAAAVMVCVPVWGQISANRAVTSSSIGKADEAAPTLPAERGLAVEQRQVARRGLAEGAGPPGAPDPSAARLGGSWVWVQTIGALAAVLVVMWLVLKLMRRAVANGSFGGPNAAVQILSRGYLTNKHQLVLLRFGQRVLLVGLGAQGAVVLSEVADPGEVAAILAKVEGAKPGSISQEFLQTMRLVAEQYEESGEPEGPQVPTDRSEQAELGSLRTELRSLLSKVQSLRRMRSAG